MTLQERPDLRLAAILFRVFCFAARQLAHEYHFRFTFEMPKDQALLRIRGPEQKEIAP